jgi:hypothetical protein
MEDTVRERRFGEELVEDGLDGGWRIVTHRDSDIERMYEML